MKKVVRKPVTVEKVVEKVVEMKDEVVDCDGGPVTLLGKDVYVSCTSYAYSGTLTGVNDKYIELSNPELVYETGPWNSNDWKDAQALPTKTLTVFMSQIESMFAVER